MTDSAHAFSFNPADLTLLAETVLAHARTLGATAAEVDVSEGVGQNVSVRLNEVETLEYNRDKGLSVSVYLGARKGHASTSDFSPTALRDTVAAALDIAHYTAEDVCSGLADPARLAQQIADLDLYHPWDLSVDEAIELARTAEAAGRAVDPRISNSEGASVSTSTSQFVYANSNGFCQGFRTSRHSISASMLAESAGNMQRDYWFDTARRADQLTSAGEIGRLSGERTVRRLDGRRVSTCQVPVLFDPMLAAGLLGHFVGAVSGGALYRQSSFLLDSLGQQVFSPLITLDERPLLPGALASTPFDSEGVAVRERRVVDAGVLQGYFLSSYSARKLGMETTGNAGGNHNLIVQSTGQDFPALLKMMDRGLLVTELLGHGVNPVTGDYSRGAAGFWVENGEIAYPVEEITIAGNLREMFRSIVAVGSDVLVRGSKQTGSILLESMTVAGE